MSNKGHLQTSIPVNRMKFLDTNKCLIVHIYILLGLQERALPSQMPQALHEISGQEKSQKAEKSKMNENERVVKELQIFRRTSQTNDTDISLNNYG